MTPSPRSIRKRAIDESGAPRSGMRFDRAPATLRSRAVRRLVGDIGVTSARARGSNNRATWIERGRRMAIAESMAAAAAHLREHPDEARYTDSRATARVERGLRVVVADPAGREVATDMVRGVGGDDSAPSPGWLFRASLASCVATFVVIRAAVLGVEPGSFEVSVESESDDRGALDLDPSVP